MPILMRRFASRSIGMSFLVGMLAARGDEPVNLRQLQSMPRERRIALSETLERFDKLNADEQAAVRKLDSELARKDPVDQARYRALLRRYHLWVNGLTDEQKAELEAAEGTEARFNIARKFRLKELAGKSSPIPNISGVRIGDFGTVAPYDMANLLRIWNQLTPAKKAVIERQQSRGRIIELLKAEQKAVGVPQHHLAPAEEKQYEESLDRDESFKKQLGNFARRVDLVAKKTDGTTKGDVAQKRFEFRFAEFLYFEDHKPKPVSQAYLERFSASCPGWLHELIDPLSPDDARAYLTIVYRLLYPEPAEMPIEAKPAKAPAAPTTAPTKSGSSRSGPAAPF